MAKASKKTAGSKARAKNSTAKTAATGKTAKKAPKKTDKRTDRKTDKKSEPVGKHAPPRKTGATGALGASTKGGKKKARSADESTPPRKTGTTGPFGTRPTTKAAAGDRATAKASAKTASAGKGKDKTKAVAKSAPGATDDDENRAVKAARAAAKEAKKAAKKGRKALKKASKKAQKAIADLSFDQAELFAPLTEGERCDAIRLVTETPRLAAMAKVGRYRVIAVEPLVFKPPEERAAHRLARVVIFDYSSARQVDASVDLDESEVFHATSSKAQPMLAPEEEADALALASADERVQAQLELGDEATAVMHYWSRHPADLAYTRRAAAVMFGPLGARPTTIAVVDLVDRTVAEVTPAAQF